MDYSLAPAELAKQIRERFPEHDYTQYHSFRYATLLNLVGRHVQAPKTILDIGDSNLTVMLAERFGCPIDVVDQVGSQPKVARRGYKFDLNDAVDPKKWPQDMDRYDLIIFSEVLEHLHVSPTHVLAFLRSVLNPGGYICIQTPNGLSLGKRIKLLLGMHPYELIRLDPNDAGHYREYTYKELLNYATEAKLELVEAIRRSYFDLRVQLGTTPAWIRYPQYYLLQVMPPNLRGGITLLLRAPL